MRNIEQVMNLQTRISRQNCLRHYACVSLYDESIWNEFYCSMRMCIWTAPIYSRNTKYENLEFTKYEIQFQSVPDWARHIHVFIHLYTHIQYGMSAVRFFFSVAHVPISVGWCVFMWLVYTKTNTRAIFEVATTKETMTRYSVRTRMMSSSIYLFIYAAAHCIFSAFSIAPVKSSCRVLLRI